MTTTELVPVAHALADLSRTATAAEIKAQVQLIQRVLAEVMIEGTHYGVIPGTGDRPSLFKAGSEQILSTFHIGVDPQIEDLSTGDEIRYRIRAKMFLQATNLFLGAGVGECSSNETKYKWREAICEQEFEDTPEDRRRIIWKRERGQEDVYNVFQVRTNPADVANTVLKIAKKRAQVDGTLTVTAASDVFAQDLEDLDEPTTTAAREARREPPKNVTGQNEVTTRVAGVSVKKAPEDAAKDWTRYTVRCADGKTYNTFDTKYEPLFVKGADITIKYKVSQYGRDILDAWKPGEPPATGKPAAKDPKPQPTDLAAKGDKVYVSDVFETAASVGWPTEKALAFVRSKFKKDLTALDKGAECIAAIKAIREEAASAREPGSDDQ